MFWIETGNIGQGKSRSRRSGFRSGGYRELRPDARPSQQSRSINTQAGGIDEYRSKIQGVVVLQGCSQMTGGGWWL